MANSADPDQLASSSQQIWIYTVCKGRVFPGSAGQGLNMYCNIRNVKPIMFVTQQFYSRKINNNSYCWLTVHIQKIKNRKKKKVDLAEVDGNVDGVP